MNILYIHHDSNKSGSSISLFEMINSLKRNFEITPTILAPGPINNDKSSKIDFLKYKFVPKFYSQKFQQNKFIGFVKNFFNFLVIPFYILFLLYLFLKKYKFQIIHVNESVLIISGLIAKLIFRAPLIVHVRSLQNDKSFTYLIHKILKRYIDFFFIIDEYVSNSFSHEHSITIRNFSNKFRNQSNTHQNKFLNNTFNVGFCANLSSYKGIDYFLSTAMKVSQMKNYNIVFHIAGTGLRNTNNILEKIFYKIFNISYNYDSYVLDFIRKNKLEKSIFFYGHIEDTLNFYKKIDLNIFPSTLDGYGRSVIESAYFGIPSIVKLSFSKNKYLLKNNINCLIIKDKSKNELMKSIIDLYVSKKKYHFLSKNVKIFALNHHDPEIITKQTYKIYNELINK